MGQRRLSDRERQRAIEKAVRDEVENECGRDRWKALQHTMEKLVASHQWQADQLSAGQDVDRAAQAQVHSDTAAVLQEIIPLLDRQYNAPSTVRHGRQEYEFPAAFRDSRVKRVWYAANRVQMNRLLMLRRLVDWAARQEKVTQRDGRYYGVLVAKAADLAQWWGCSEPTARQTMADLCRWGYAHERGVVYDSGRIGTAYMLGRRHAGVGLAKPSWTWIEPADKVVPDAGGGETHELAPAVPDWADLPLHPDQVYRFSYDDALNVVSATME